MNHAQRLEQALESEPCVPPIASYAVVGSWLGVSADAIGKRRKRGIWPAEVFLPTGNRTKALDVLRLLAFLRAKAAKRPAEASPEAGGTP